MKDKIEKILRGYLPYTGAEDKNIPYKVLTEELSNLIKQERRDTLNGFVKFCNRYESLFGLKAISEEYLKEEKNLS